MYEEEQQSQAYGRAEQERFISFASAVDWNLP